MKKKLLLFLLMFMFMTNVSALTFDVNVTNIEDQGNGGTIGSIENIDLENRTLNVLFQNIGDEVNFSITVTNTGNRAGILSKVDITSENDKIVYTTNVPTEGISINGNDTNEIFVKAKVIDGATNGTSTSEIKIKYVYDEGSCPEGEILSEDETMCSCPEGKERNEFGICVTPETPVECADDEIYNTESKTCEKKVVPVEPDKPTPVIPNNPTTLDNIILITLLFIVSGLGIYAAMFKKLKTSKQKKIGGVVTGVITLSASFIALASVFGLDNLLGAIVNPIAKEKYLTVNVNETIDMAVTWDGNCVTNSYSPESVFEGGSGTESDPYKIKTANQLACFALSVNNGNSYEGQFVKQIRDIKLNDNLNDNINNNTTDGLHEWTPIGDSENNKSFNGTYDGDNHTVSGVYIKDGTLVYSSKGLFGYASNAVLKNINISDAYFNSSRGTGIGVLLGTGVNSLVVDNVTTNGTQRLNTGYNYYNINRAGVIGNFNGNGSSAGIRIENTTNNVDNGLAGIIKSISGVSWSDEPNIIFRNVTNNGYVSLTGGLSSSIGVQGNVLIDNCANTGDVRSEANASVQVGGLLGDVNSGKLTIKKSHNSGDVISYVRGNTAGGIGGILRTNNQGILIEDCFNSGSIATLDPVILEQVKDGVTNDEFNTIKQAAGYTFINDASIGGISAIVTSPDNIVIKDSYNVGQLSGHYIIGGIVAYHYEQNILYDGCYNSGSIFVGLYPNVGGIAGWTNGTIRNSHNSGTITIWGNMGMSGPNLSGGLIGWSKSHAPNVTGAVDAVIENSYNEGDILVTAKFAKADVAGLCAKCASITDSTNSGDINIKYATQSYDGIRLEGSGAITNTEFTGEVILQNLPF